MFLHLSVILFTRGGVGFPACVTGHMTGGSAYGGSLSRGGGLHPLGRGFVSGGLYPGGSASRGGGSASGRKGVCPTHPLDTTGYGQREGSTHPTGMHSCLYSEELTYVGIFPVRMDLTFTDLPTGSGSQTCVLLEISEYP